MRINKKAELQISFAWLFAIIVGAMIIFLAIYLSIRIIQTGEEIQDAKTGKDIGILLNPLETGFETAKTTSLTFPVDTRIYNSCSREGYFGKQLISVSQKSFNKWTKTKINVGFSNKYIFSEKVIEGKENIVFTKPFEFPFKVSDLIYIFPSSQFFCFRDAPDGIKRELSGINHENLKFENCSSAEFTNVCFIRGSGCDVIVDYNLKYIEKNNTRMYFEGDALMYGAIFSEPEIYECQLERLMKRIVSLTRIYLDKGAFISREGCHFNLESELLVLGNSAGRINSSLEIGSLLFVVEEAESKNNANVGCRLW